MTQDFVALARTISRYFLIALLACGTMAAQGRPAATAPIDQNAAGAAGISNTNAGRRSVASSAVIRSRRSSHSASGAPSPSKSPPSPPQISYVGGQLTIVANNSALSDVLNAIQNTIGAKIEGVKPSDGDRVFGQFGPDSPRAVCGKLLAGSSYDFILLGASQDPESIQRIILTGRSTEMASSPPANRPVPEQPPVADTDDSEDMSATDNPAEAPGQAPMPPDQQQVAPADAAQSQQATPDQQPAPYPTHPQHWGVGYPRPSQQTPPPQPTPEPPH